LINIFSFFLSFLPIFIFSFFLFIVCFNICFRIKLFVCLLVHVIAFQKSSDYIFSFKYFFVILHYRKNHTHI
jgi:hypothetical protein